MAWVCAMEEVGCFYRNVSHGGVYLLRWLVLIMRVSLSFLFKIHRLTGIEQRMPLFVVNYANPNQDQGN